MIITAGWQESNPAGQSCGRDSRHALFVLSITLGLRPGELRKLTWDHVDLPNAVIHVWRLASPSGDTKPRSQSAPWSS